MKSFFTLLTSLFLSVAVFAADYAPGVLSIKSAGKREIQVMIDGKMFTPGKNILMVDNVTPGFHSIIIYRRHHGADNTYKFEEVYSDTLSVRPRRDILISIDRKGNATIEYKRKEKKEVAYNTTNDDGYFTESRSYAAYTNAISAKEFAGVMNAMQKEWTEKNRMQSASFIISGNFFTAEQVKDMMSLFSIEDNKLEIAKQAYTKTLDKENYDRVMNALDYRNKDDLARYIRDCE